MTVVDAGKRYDSYWRERDEGRTCARSRSRASIVVDLLRERQLPRERDGEGHTSLLEVGCGPGWALEVFREHGFDVRGVDVSAEAVDRARARGLDVGILDLEAGSTPAERYDVVVALEVLEHLADPLDAIERIRGLVANDGAFVVSLPNEIHLLRRLSILFGWMSFGGHDDPHLHHFDDRSARRFLHAAGLRVLATRSDSIVPPRFGGLRALTGWAKDLAPGLLALSNVYLLGELDVEAES